MDASTTLPTTTKGWVVRGATGFESLSWEEAIPIPTIGRNDVLVRIRAASLNYRDLMVAKGEYKFGMKDNVIPGSDGAGEVVAVGPGVQRFQPGDMVVTVLHRKDPSGSKRALLAGSGLGGLEDGTLRQYGVFSEEGLIDMPPSLNWLEASTLTCAGLTAWNALYGLVPIRAGHTILTQGTGGVSIFAIQFAIATGAKVIATTSSEEKCSLLKKIGAHHVINYRKDYEWGTTAKSLTANGGGVDFVVDVGGAATLGQSLAAVKRGGQVALVGYLGGQSEERPLMMEAFRRMCVVRGVAVGDRRQFSDMNAAVEHNNITPLVDRKVFRLEDAREAYQYLGDAAHVGKVVVSIVD